MDTADIDNVDTNTADMDTADTNTDAAVTTFTLEDVEKLNYIIIDNNVYDLTEFEEDHPGGAGVLRYFKGKNATEKFHSIPSHDNEHIKKKLLTFLKGTLEKK
jgi:cytochrome-b5 reductase